MISYEKLFEECDLLPEIQNTIRSYLTLYDWIKFTNLNKAYYNKYKALNHVRTEKFIKYIKMLEGRSFFNNDTLRSLVFLMKIIEHNGFKSEIIIERFCYNEKRGLQEFFLTNLGINNKQANCHNCKDGPAIYRKVYYKPYEYVCCVCKEPLKYGIKDFMLDFETQLKWHKDNLNIIKDDITF